MPTRLRRVIADSKLQMTNESWSPCDHVSDQIHACRGAAHSRRRSPWAEASHAIAAGDPKQLIEFDVNPYPQMASPLRPTTLGEKSRVPADGEGHRELPAAAGGGADLERPEEESHRAAVPGLPLRACG